LEKQKICRSIWEQVYAFYVLRSALFFYDNAQYKSGIIFYQILFRDM
jgi:hypothetical protein